METHDPCSTIRVSVFSGSRSRAHGAAVHSRRTPERFRLENCLRNRRPGRYPIGEHPAALSTEIVMSVPVNRPLAMCVIMLSGLAALGSTPPEAVPRPDLNGTRV